MKLNSGDALLDSFALDQITRDKWLREYREKEENIYIENNNVHFHRFSFFSRASWAFPVFWQMGFGDFYILYLLFFIYTCKLGIPGLLTDGSAKFLTFSKLTNNTWQLPRRIYEFYFIVVIFSFIYIRLYIYSIYTYIRFYSIKWVSKEIREHLL